ncbi:hypothetical protein KBZ21_18020 [Streptomyces sp. A73]|nr:hypothetical protein [Streptomyces sp. A73]
MADPVLTFAAELITRLGRVGEWGAVARLAPPSALFGSDPAELTAEVFEAAVVRSGSSWPGCPERPAGASRSAAGRCPAAAEGE